MFEFSVGEMLVVAVVALLVLGPERLPRAARMAGLWVRRARAHWYAVQTELEHELAADDLRRTLHASHDAIHGSKADVHAALTDTPTAPHTTPPPASPVHPHHD